LFFASGVALRFILKGVQGILIVTETDSTATCITAGSCGD